MFLSCPCSALSTCITCCLCLYSFRKRRSPSPPRRRRSPSPPRRRRSPSPPRRRYVQLLYHIESFNLSNNFYGLKKIQCNNYICSYPGPLPRLPVVVLHPPDDILPLSSVATAPHLCPHRRGKCLALPQSALLQGPSDAPPGPPSAETPLLKGDACLHPHLHPDTGGAPCCLLLD